LIEEAQAADLIVVMHEGRVLHSGAPDEVLRHEQAGSGAEAFVAMTAKAD
jgi:ABC-type hemin transport system ATPase subunit